MSSVKGFYKDKSIFVTGVSGFMGKVLLEKILYSCSDVKQIFVLMREKRGKTGAERVKDFTKIPLFERLNNEKSEMFEKIVPIYGDICLNDLGMSNDDLTQVITETDIVFHMAASVNFEEPVKNAVAQNVRAVKYVIDIAKRMPNLVSMVHLSTAFCNTDQKVMDEVTYDWDMDPLKLLDCADVMDDEILESIRKILLKTHPNIYTYTKRLAEILVRDEHKHLPICIVRPSIVLPSYREPVSGWVDNLNGPIGILIGAGKGVVRTMLCDKNAKFESIPVDFATRGIILCAWQTALRSKPEKVAVYNLTVEKDRRLTWGQFINGLRKYVMLTPLSGGVWYPGGDMTTSSVEYYLRLAFTQLLPALLIDGICLLTGRDTFMMKIQKKIRMGCNVLHRFSISKYDFTVKKIVELQNQLLPSEKEEFEVFPDEVDVEEYLRNCIKGCRYYILKDKPETIPAAIRHIKLLRVLDIAAQIMWLCLIYWIVKNVYYKFISA